MGGRFGFPLQVGARVSHRRRKVKVPGGGGRLHYLGYLRRSFAFQQSIQALQNWSERIGLGEALGTSATSYTNRGWSGFDSCQELVNDGRFADAAAIRLKSCSRPAERRCAGRAGRCSGGMTPVV